MSTASLETAALNPRAIVPERNPPGLCDPSFFIVGFAGSGATHLSTILNAHPQLAVAPELNWITDFFDTPSGPNLDGLLARPLLAKWIEQKKFDPLDISREEIQKIITAEELVPCRQFISRLLDVYGRIKAKEQVGSRTLEFIRFIAALHDSWPWTKFIHLIRDGRSICVKLLARQDETLRGFSTWAQDPVVTIGLWWKRKVQQGREAGRKIGLYHELRYEKLIENPEEEYSRLCRFLGIPFDDGWRCAGDISKLGDLAGTTLPLAGVSKESSDWRTQMSAQNLERFEATAGDLLEELGYERAFPRPRAEAVACVSRLQQEFAHPLVWRKTSPPSLMRRRAKAGWTNPCVFIVGCPRSGTTLLQRILDAHPLLAICPETFWVVYFFKKRIGLTPDGCVTPELVSRLLNYYKFYRMKAAKADLDHLLSAERSISYSAFVTGLFDHYGEYWRKPLVGDKTPDYVRNLPTLHSLWPRAKIVHLIRDGRDVCLSATNWKRKTDRLRSQFTTWEKHPVITAALWWEWHVRKGREDSRSVGPELYYELRYEALIAGAKEECARLCDFLGLGTDELM